MRVTYISPSTLFSRAANSVHVVRMCEAIASLDHTVTLFAHSAREKKGNLVPEAEAYYGVQLPRVRIHAFWSKLAAMINLRIAAMACKRIVLESMMGHAPDLVISRNLYASFLLSKVCPGRLVFETHQLEPGFRKWLQRKVLLSSRVQTVVISKALAKLLEEHHGVQLGNVHVLADAAPAGRKLLSESERTLTRNQLFSDHPASNYKYWAGYFGHLYKGRGIEIIQSLATQHPDVAFLVFGGNEREIKALTAENKSANLFVMGFIEPSHAISTMALMDALLMPYQRSVMISERNDQDTSRWMSPMKMFEYMSVGGAIISSALPALEEVLTHEINALLAAPDNAAEWSSHLKALRTNRDLARRLSVQAFHDYETQYNWRERARRMIALAGSVNLTANEH